MKILAIETSCDETAISIIETNGKFGEDFHIKVLANEVLSQIDIHQKYGGIFPMLAKREHSRNLVPLLKQALRNAGFGNPKSEAPNPKQIQNSKPEILKTILEREPELLGQFEKEIPKLEKPPTCPVRNREGSQRDCASNGIDAITVTKGPGLEPTLWTGINFAKALSLVWNIPIIPINHMEGHIFASLLRKEAISNFQFPISKQIPKSKSKKLKIKTSQLTNFKTYKLAMLTFPAVALLVSGGHTELIEMKNWFSYKILGATRDDAVGETFDKVARILGLPYPGGPQISALAEISRKDAEQAQNNAEKIKLPRPMIKSDDFDFSFSGIKTAVLYLVQRLTRTDQASVREGLGEISMSPRVQSLIAREFEDAIVETLVAKTRRAISETGAKTLIVGGGVAANKLLRQKLAEMARRENTDIFISEIPHSTDNALMIAVAAAARLARFGGKSLIDKDFKAKGRYKIDEL
jgi:N6-L-threonylcarbamoyladenine synthase